MVEGRKRGIIFDVGHGGASFRYSAAVPMMKAGFVPDSISTDLHTSSMNSAMKGQLNVMGKFMAMGLSLNEVVRMSTTNPARQIKLDELGHLGVGAPADVAVLRVEKGNFGFVDPVGGRIDATQRLACELRSHHFDRVDLPLARHELRAVDLRHAAAGDQAQQVILAEGHRVIRCSGRQLPFL